MMMMTMNIFPLLLTWLLVEAEELIPQVEVHVHAQRVFKYSFNPSMFRWSHGDVGGLVRYTYSYLPSLEGLPDMPTWMKYKYSQRHKAGFIYGVPPRAKEVFNLDVVATNRDTFETGLLKVVINVTSSIASPGAASFNVKLKIDNLNIEDIFDPHRLKNLKSLYTEQFWPESKSDLHLTFIASSLVVGYRRPLRPTEKDGVVLQLGSQANFSQDLLNLERETTPLRVLPSCPRNFKRTSVERYFREKGFAIDWCAFRLMTLDNQLSSEDTTAIYKELETTDNDNDDPDGQDLNPIPNQYQEHLRSLLYGQAPIPSRNSVPYRNISKEFMYTAIPAALVFLITSLILFALLCFKRRNEPEEEWQAFTESLFLVVKDCFTCCNAVDQEKETQTRLIDSNSTLTAIDPVRARRASSVQRQTDSLKRLAYSRDVTPMLQMPTQQPFVPGQPPPPSWMNGDDPRTLGSSPSSSLAQFGFMDTGRASLNPSNFEALMQRPAPPPYASCNKIPQDDDGTYLV